MQEEMHIIKSICQIENRGQQSQEEWQIYKERILFYEYFTLLAVCLPFSYFTNFLSEEIWGGR